MCTRGFHSNEALGRPLCADQLEPGAPTTPSDPRWNVIGFAHRTRPAWRPLPFLFGLDRDWGTAGRALGTGGFQGAAGAVEAPSANRPPEVTMLPTSSVEEESLLSSPLASVDRLGAGGGGAAVFDESASEGASAVRGLHARCPSSAFHVYVVGVYVAGFCHLWGGGT